MCSPILEASQEDTRSSASSSSPTQISTVKLEQIPEKLELIHTTDEITNDVENASGESATDNLLSYSRLKTYAE